MSNEVELARIAMWTEAIKILGPAILTGLLGYFMGRLDYKRRLTDMKSTQEFSAREVLFNLKKQRYDSMLESASSFNKSLREFYGYYLGYSAGSEGDGLPVTLIAEMLDVVVEEMLDAVRWVTDEFGATEHYLKEKDEIIKIKAALDQYKSP